MKALEWSLSRFVASCNSVCACGPASASVTWEDLASGKCCSPGKELRNCRSTKPRSCKQPAGFFLAFRNYTPWQLLFLHSLQQLSRTPMQMSYWRFAAMIATSTVVMFGLMYLNTFALDHVWFSQTRAWMAVLMGAVMAVIMLGFMWSMYHRTRLNIAIVVVSVAAFSASLWLVRSQETVSDVSYMKAMIPHHSIAIMTSERAHISDPRVRKLADRIIAAQVREIGEMEQLISDLERHPTQSGAPDLPPAMDESTASK